MDHVLVQNYTVGNPLFIRATTSPELPSDGFGRGERSQIRRRHYPLNDQ